MKDIVDVLAGCKVVFSEEFKKIINDLPIQDWLWYNKETVFEVKEAVDGKASIKGLHCLGFRPFNYFTKVQCKDSQ